MSGAMTTGTVSPGGSDMAEHEAVRILAAGNMYPPQLAGGYEIAWQQVVRHAQGLGHHVRVLASDYVADAGRPEQEPDVHRCLRWYWDLERYEFPRHTLRERLLLERHNASMLRRHLHSFRPHVVAWWSMGCMSLSLIEQARRHGHRSVFIVHDDWLVYGWEHDQWLRTWRGPRRGRLAPIADRLSRIPTRVCLQPDDRFVFNSRYTLERAREAGAPVDNACVVHPGIDPSFLQPLEPQPWAWRMAYIGRLDRQKGIDTAVAALGHLPRDATLDVWGTGDDDYVAEMTALAGRLGVSERVRFRGFAAPAAVRDAYRSADVIVFPVRWNEPFGLVPVEAMGLGRPVVTTARGGTAEFVRNEENALVFQADDAEALAACVRRLAGSASLRTALRAGGQQTARRFTAQRFAEATVSAITAAADHATR